MSSQFTRNVERPWESRVEPRGYLLDDFLVSKWGGSAVWYLRSVLFVEGPFAADPDVNSELLEVYLRFTPLVMWIN